jgi:hypothetical protein
MRSTSFVGLLAVGGVSALCTILCAAGHAAAAAYNLRFQPQASFVWSPQLPHIGEPIVLTSTSSEPSRHPLRYAWDFHDNGSFGAFEAGSSVAGASFATPGQHVVRLRVTNFEGVSSITAETIQMAPLSPAAGVIYPFPRVRIRGRDFPAGVRIRQLAVRAPAGVHIAVSCRGRRCPVSSSRKSSASTGEQLRWTRFRRFQRLFPAGVVLEIRAWASGRIGAYTRFAVRRRRLPVRSDSCLDAAGRKPIPCPTS